MTLALTATILPTAEAAPVTKAAAAPVENLTLVAALSCLMSAVYFLATSLVG